MTFYLHGASTPFFLPPCSPPRVRFSSSPLPSPQAHVCSSDVVSAWNEFSKCPYIKEERIVYHPGEVCEQSVE